MARALIGSAKEAAGLERAMSYRLERFRGTVSRYLSEWCQMRCFLRLLVF